MAFLNKSMLAKMAVGATVAKHPMLEKVDVPLNIKEMYLQGCVLAAIQKDEKLSDAKRTAVFRLGASLQLSETEVREAISIVTGLSSDDAKEEFVCEMRTVLSGDIYPRYFLRDFENLLKDGEELSSDMADILDYFGSMLCNCADWRKALSDEGHKHPEEPPVVQHRDSKHFPARGKSAVPGCATHSLGGIVGGLADGALEALDDSAGVRYIDVDKCVGCGCCKDACPSEAISEGSPYVIDLEKCVDCGACEATCPNEAIVCCGSASPCTSPNNHSSYGDNPMYADPLFDRVRRVIVEQVDAKPSQVTPETTFTDGSLNFDEFDGVEILMALEEEFGLVIPDEDWEKLTTAGAVVNYLHSKGF